MKIRSTLIMLLVASLPITTFAAETLLKGSQITEENLLENLTPTQDRPLTRSIKVTRDETTSARPQKSARAGLLMTFQTASSELLPETKKALDTVAKALQNDKLANFQFNIEGHADPRGGNELNIRLSQARAESVVNYLISVHGIAPERLKPIGMGSAELLNKRNPTAPENRRVSITTIQ